MTIREKIPRTSTGTLYGSFNKEYSIQFTSTNLKANIVKRTEHLYSIFNLKSIKQLMVMAGKRSVTSLFKRLSEVAAYRLRTVLAAERKKRKVSESHKLFTYFSHYTNLIIISLSFWYFYLINKDTTFWTKTKLFSFFFFLVNLIILYLQWVHPFTDLSYINL